MAAVVASSPFCSSSHSSVSTSPSGPASPARWLSWAGHQSVALRALAQCLPFADADSAVPPLNTVGHHSAFLSLARTCRAAYELLTSDAACWATQRLHFDMNDGLFDFSDFMRGHGAFTAWNSDMLLCSRLTERRRETLRRVFGEDGYDRLMAPLTAEVQTVWLGQDRDDVYQAVQRDASSPAVTAVYPNCAARALAPAELQRRGLTMHDMATAWMFGCYSFLLLPPCIRLAPAASVTLAHEDMNVQITCLYLLLQRLPAVKELTFDAAASTARRHPQSTLHPPGTLLWDWQKVRRALPRLRALTLRDIRLGWGNVLQPLLSATDMGELRSLSIDTRHCCVTSSDRHLDGEPFTFHFPPRADGAPAAADAVDEPLEDDSLSAVQLRLQSALCRQVKQQLLPALGRGGAQAEELASLVTACEEIERLLLARQEAAEQQPRAKRARVE